MALSATIKTRVSGSLTNPPDIGSATHEFNELFSLEFADGTGAGQASNMWSDERVIAASGTDSIDLAGSLSNALGATLTFTAIKAIVVVADAGNTNNVVVGGAASNTFAGPFSDASDKVSVKPGGMFLIGDGSAAGWTVTAGTGDVLQVANSGSGSSVTYKIIIFGEA